MRWQLAIQGVVQGVGFRPFVHNLACRLRLGGWVRNTSTGVEMELEGALEGLEAFLGELRDRPPPLARMLDVRVSEKSGAGDGRVGLEIRESHTEAGRTLVSPDVAICDACLREMRDPADRRFGYAFTNCTHCGPRWTIVLDLPYDRPRTTMAGFPLCPACGREYGDPTDRRFHAQPVACPACGPVLWYSEGKDVQGPGDRCPVGAEAIEAAVRCLDRGGVLALKGLGGFHLSCRADRLGAVRRLRQVKRRPHKPLAVMVRRVEAARAFCEVTEAEGLLLAAPEAPVVLLSKLACPEYRLAAEIAPGNGCVGVMLPYTPLHHLLRARADGPLVMTSGNPIGEPLCIDNAEVVARLGAFTDAYLFHNRPIARRCDDSVMLVAGLPDAPVTQPVRRSRGLAPLPVFLPEGVEVTVALAAAGADLKNVSAVARGRQVFLTPHIGDLAHPAAREEQAGAISDLERMFRIRPEAVACDLHPGYASSRYARQRAQDEGLALVEVQHHHAHIAGCLAENGHTGPAIGLCFDGTGYGTDGRIWGGEVLLADLAEFERVCHLEYLPLPGGDAAVRRPYRIAMAYVHHLLPNLDVRRFFPDVPERQFGMIKTMVAQGLNSPLTSSMGRLFDAVSALLGLCREATHEAQAAMALEDAALRSRADGPCYDLPLHGDAIRLQSLFEGIVADVQNGVPAPDIARRFHQSVAALSRAAARAVQAREAESGRAVNQVALSGGVWQNRLLLEVTAHVLRDEGFEVLVHHAVPANDGGLAYGQAAVAAGRMGGVLDFALPS